MTGVLKRWNPTEQRWDYVGYPVGDFLTPAEGDGRYYTQAEVDQAVDNATGQMPKLIAEVHTTPSDDEIVFDGIPQDFADLQVTGMLRSESENAATLRCEVNNVDTSSYLSLRTRTTPTAVSADEDVDDRGWRVAVICGTNSPNVADFTPFRMLVPDYSSQPPQTGFMSECFSRLATNFSESHRGEVTISGGAPVTRLRFFQDVGDGQFADGTVLRLYGHR